MRRHVVRLNVDANGRDDRSWQRAAPGLDCATTDAEMRRQTLKTRQDRCCPRAQLVLFDARHGQNRKLLIELIQMSIGGRLQSSETKFVGTQCAKQRLAL